MPFLLLMPSYNQAHFIVDTIRSILDQDDPDWQLWIVDNSTDSTPDVVKQFDDSRIVYRHIPQRMCPGSCLNWVLGRADGEFFSYVHTDNILHKSYVSKMRAALRQSPMSLAYCDMCTIDDTGTVIGINRRGAFDLPRLLSLDPLGVPFSATVKLAKEVGGFSENDLADDVRFCAAAYGLAQYVYLREPLIDYRLHQASRTEISGGPSRVKNAFMRTACDLRPILEARGLVPAEALAEGIADYLDDFDWMLEDIWYKKLSKSVRPWWKGRPTATNFFYEGLLWVPGFTRKQSAPPRWSRNISWIGQLKVALYFLLRKRELRKSLDKSKQLLFPWALLASGCGPGEAFKFQVSSLDFRTVWLSRQLENEMGWQPTLSAKLTSPPWLNWTRADGSEPRLECPRAPRLIKST